MIVRVGAIAVALAVGAGCASLQPPFDALEKSPATMMRLGPPPPPPAAVAPGITLPAIPGVPPELQAAGQQILDAAKQVLPPGLIPQQPAAVVPEVPKFKTFAILQQSPVMDENLHEELLDIFGHEDSFQAAAAPCFTPGMGLSFQRTDGGPPVDLLISLSCAQAQGDGFVWPYKVNGFTPETSSRLRVIFERYFGPAPAAGI